jgi:disease resistance protein RPM1
LIIISSRSGIDYAVMPLFRQISTDHVVRTPLIVSLPFLFYRYFIFIDDVWSVTSWKNIWESLPRNQKGSSIVVTTRFKSVANACCHDKEHIYMLEPLPHAASTQLFFKTVTDPKPEEFKETKDEIIQKCGGLPLAIVAVAGLLARRDLTEKSQWETVKESLNSDLDKKLTPEGVTQILNLCYNDLSADQKNCLLYLSIFPKGCSINRKRLIRRWISEGFIAEKDGKTVEEVAEDSFNELIGRNIVRAVEHSTNGKVKPCQVHDMILEYIVSKSSEENFITVIGGHWLTATPSNKVRRLSLHNSNPDDIKEKIENMNLSHVRSLTVFENLHNLPSYSFKSVILQVLDLEGCKNLNTNQLKKIFKMFQLKYLSLRNMYIKKLPSEIGKLQYLETLDVRETNVTELPSSIGRLQKMVHLLGGNKSTRLSLRFTEEIAKMTALQTLSGIEINTGLTPDLGSMHSLTRLKKLSIYNLRDFHTSNELLPAIEHLTGYSLKSLAIDDGFSGFLNSMDDLSTPPKYILSLDLSGKLFCVPKWIKELETLEKLTLSLTSLRTDGLQVLSQLPKMFSLTFSMNAKGNDSSAVEILQKNKMHSGGKIFVPAGGFVSLKLLRLSAPVIPLLSFLEGAMPQLLRLELQFRLSEGAYGLENLESLQQVYLRVSQQASDATKEKLTNIRSSVSMHSKKPTIVVDECYE